MQLLLHFSILDLFFILHIFPKLYDIHIKQKMIFQILKHSMYTLFFSES